MSSAAPFQDLPDPGPQEFERIAEVVYRHTGIRLGPNKGYFVVGRLGGLYRELGCSGWGDLPGRLAEPSDRLVDSLVQAVITPETQFFRDELPFRALRERIVPEVCAGRGRPALLRVWSAGCSTGQEPYSVAMALWDLVESGALDLDVWATDICAASLETARRGEYGELELRRGLDPECRRRFLEELGGDRARVIPAVRRAVRFERVNLTEGESRGRSFHVVFCRNVGIYFDRPGKERLYGRLARAVLPGGYLVLGAAETLFPSVAGFETVYFGRCLLFRRSPSEGP